jgi:pyruvate dehydrogenase E1 component
LSFLATINHVACASLGVTRFGQSGSLEDVYRYHGLDADSIVSAALDLTN